MKRQLSSFQFIIVLAALMLAALGASFYWGSMANSYGFLASSFQQFDRQVSADQDSCFILNLDNQGYWKQNTEIEVLAGKTLAGKQTINLEEQSVYSGCVPSSMLNQGDNLIEVRIDEERLFYHSLKSTSLNKKVPQVEILEANDETVKIRVQNNDNTSFEPLMIYLNGELDHQVYFSGDAVFEEKVDALPGENTVKAVFKNQGSEANFQHATSWQSHWLLGLIILLFVFSVFWLFVFPSQGFVERMAYSLAGFFGLLGLSGFLLLLAGQGNPQAMVVLSLAASLGVAFLFRRRFKNVLIKFNKINAFQIVVILLFLGSAIFFSVFTENHVSPWTSYYERQSMTLAELEVIPLQDPLSFLGSKPYGYFSLYFPANAGFNWLLNLGSAQYFSQLMLFAKIFILAALLVFLKKLKLSEHKQYLAVMLFFLTSFVFGDLIFSARHLMSLGFMFLALSFVLSNKARPAGLLAGLATATQTPVFGLFFLAGVIFAEKKHGKTFVKSLLAGSALSLVFYLPFLLSLGLPFQANASEWGFLFGMPWYGVLFDLVAFAFFLGFFVLPYILKKEVKFDTLAWKYAIAAVLLILVQLFLTYRVNIVTALTLAVLSVKLLPENFTENRFARHALTGMFVFGILIASNITVGYSIPAAAMDSYHYLNDNSGSQAHVLNEPALGHSTALFAQRQITADLAVEYADESMINDSYAFLQTGNNEILEKYDVDFVLNRKNFIEVQPVGSPSLDHDLEFEALDKVYTNGFYFVHWNN